MSCLARPEPPLPVTVQELCDRVGQVEGVRLAELLQTLGLDSPTGDVILAEILTEAQAVPPDRAYDIATDLARWGPELEALVAACHGHPTAGHVLRAGLSTLHGDWAQLADCFARVLDGSRDHGLLTDLDPVDTAILTRAFDLLDDAAAADATPDALIDQLIPEELSRLVRAVVQAARGDAEAGVTLDGLLQEIDPPPGVVERVRRCIAGERDPDELLPGLGPLETALLARVLDVLAGRSHRI